MGTPLVTPVPPLVDVLDTNVLIAAFVFAKVAAPIRTAVLARRLRLAVCGAIVDEYGRAVRYRKLRMTEPPAVTLPTSDSRRILRPARPLGL